MSIVKLKAQQWLLKIRNNRMKEKVFKQPSQSSVSSLIAWMFVKYSLTIILAGMILFPLYYMIMASLMTVGEASNIIDPTIKPDEPQWGNYKTVFQDGYFRSLLISLTVTSFSITSQLVVTSLMGYAFAFKKWRFKKPLWIFYLSLLMMPQLALMMGQYQLIVDVGWNYGSYTLLSMFVPYAASVMSAYMFKNAFEAIPDRTKEAALLDGVSETKYFFKIALPMVKPAFWTVAILTAFASWNSFAWPSLIFGGEASEYRPLSLWLFGAGKISLQPDTDPVTVTNLQMAASVLVTLPLVVSYFMLRSRIMNAISKQGSAIKG